MKFKELKPSECRKPYYRYRGLTPDVNSGIVYAVDEIKNNTLFFSLPQSLNDPFECRFKFKDLNDEDYRELVSKYGDGLSPGFIPSKKAFMSKFYEMRQKFFLNSGIVCFTPKENDHLMWSHYAAGHQGICVEYDLNRIISQLTQTTYKDVVAIVVEIGYTNIFPTVSIEDDSLSDLYDVIFTKDDIWDYEHEVRYAIVPNDEKNTGWNRTISFEKQIIKSVTLGAKISKWNKELVNWVCGEKGIPVIEMGISDKEYELVSKQKPR